MNARDSIIIEHYVLGSATPEWLRMAIVLETEPEFVPEPIELQEAA